MTTTSPRTIHDGGRYFEGPRWHAGRLWFVDCMARTLNNLAALYLYQGRHDDAEPLLKRAVTVFEKSLGPTSPELVESLDNLAALYKDKGRTAEAAPIAKRAAAIRARATGQKI